MSNAYKEGIKKNCGWTLLISVLIIYDIDLHMAAVQNTIMLRAPSIVDQNTSIQKTSLDRHIMVQLLPEIKARLVWRVVGPFRCLPSMSACRVSFRLLNINRK